MHAHGTKFTKDKGISFPVLSHTVSLPEANSVPSFLIISINTIIKHLLVSDSHILLVRGTASCRKYC